MTDEEFRDLVYLHFNVNAMPKSEKEVDLMLNYLNARDSELSDEQRATLLGLSRVMVRRLEEEAEKRRVASASHENQSAQGSDSPK